MIPFATAVFFELTKNAKVFRKNKMHHDRRTWNEDVEYLLHSDEFTNTYRMPKEGFDNLLEILCPSLTADIIKSQNSTKGEMDPIFPELIMGVGLRLLKGGQQQDIRDWARISRSSFYCCRDMFLDTVLCADELAIKWPGGNIMELNTLAYGFRLKSTHGIMDKCVGALDSMLVSIEQPKEVDNPHAYFSGHYKHMGVNV